MCRLIAYLGEPVTLSRVLLEPEYALLRQSYEPRHQAHGRMNADGFGVGWYAPEVRALPARYRKPTPMWTDQTFANIAGARVAHEPPRSTLYAGPKKTSEYSR